MSAGAPLEALVLAVGVVLTKRLGVVATSSLGLKVTESIYLRAAPVVFARTPRSRRERLWRRRPALAADGRGVSRGARHFSEFSGHGFAERRQSGKSARAGLSTCSTGAEPRV